MPSKIKINFLGTSAQIPTEKRNHTGILISYNSESILIDCGEGIQRQFRIAKINPGKITKILITHWHADHVLGIPGILSTLALSGYNKTLEIYGPKGTKQFMKELLQVFNFQKKYEIKVNEIANSGVFFENKEFYLESESMQHGIPANAYAFVIKDKIRLDKAKLKKSKMPKGKHLSELQKGKDITLNGKKYRAKDFVYEEKGRKISIILDTLNNPKTEKFAKNSDILICEASFGNDLEEHAKEHMHLTAFQAGHIAKKSVSKKLILTHISQRYENNIKSLLDDAKKNFKNSVVANDFDEFDI